MADELNKIQDSEDNFDDILDNLEPVKPTKKGRKATLASEKRKKFVPKPKSNIEIPDIDYDSMDDFLFGDDEPEGGSFESAEGKDKSSKSGTKKTGTKRRKGAKLPKDVISDILTGEREVPVEKKKEEGIGTALTALSRNAKKIKKNFNIRFMNADSTKQKIAVLESKIKEYLEIGDEDSAKACADQLYVLKNMVMKNRETNESGRRRVKESKEVKEYVLEIKALRKRLSDINPVMIVRKLRTLRKDCEDLEVINKYDKIDYDSVSDFDDIYDIDVEALEEEAIPSKAELDKLMIYISKLTDTPVAVLEEMNFYRIQKLIEESTAELDEERKKINEEIELKTAEMYVLKNKLRGYSDITDAMFEIFDYKEIEQNPDEQREMESVIAASMIDYTIGTAYNTCARLGMLHLLDDAVGAGLVALAVKIKDWFNIQKRANSSISFVDICAGSIAETIRTALNEIAYSGMASGSVINNDLKREKDREERLLANIRATLGENAKDIPDNLLLSAYTADTIKNAKANSIEGMSEVIGKDESDDVDPYNFISRRDTDENTFGEAKIVYGNFIDNIKALFRLFETTKSTGRVKRIFTTKDYLIFKMHFGFMQIKDPQTGEIRHYNQEEMAEVLHDWEIKHPDKVNHNRDINKRMTQSSISTCVNELIKKLKKACELYPEVKEGLEYCLLFIQQNPNAFAVLSNTTDIRFEDKERVLDKFDRARENELKYQEILVDEEPSINAFEDINEISAAISEIHEWQEYYKKSK